MVSRKTLEAHGADASTADHAGATTLTSDWHQETALLVVNCVKFHLISKRSLPKFQTEMF